MIIKKTIIAVTILLIVSCVMRAPILLYAQEGPPSDEMRFLGERNRPPSTSRPNSTAENFQPAIESNQEPIVTQQAAQTETGQKAEMSLKEGLVSLDLKDVKIDSALKIISQASGMNIIFDKDVSALVTITLKDVSWQTALDNILKINQLAYRIQDNTIRIMTLATVKNEEVVVPLTTKVLTLNFAKADVLQASLGKMLSARGSIVANLPTNSLIVTDTPQAITQVEEMCKQLDICAPQVMIEAIIMSIKLTDTNKFGIDWTATDQVDTDRSFSQSLQAPSTVLDLAYSNMIIPRWKLDTTISMYTENKNVNILANPRILTMDNMPAQIEITEQVPYTFTSTSAEGTSAGTSSTQFRETGIKLYVTPHITKDKFVLLAVKAEQSFVSSFVGTTNEPAVDSRRADTNFMLKDTDTIVIGGLKKKEVTTTKNRVPILGYIPILGSLFTKEVKEVTETELVIFITPYIINEPKLTDTQRQDFEKSQNGLSRNKLLQQALDGMSKTGLENAGITKPKEKK